MQNQQCPPALWFNKLLKAHRKYSYMSSYREVYPFLIKITLISVHFSQMETFNTIPESH